MSVGGPAPGGISNEPLICAVHRRGLTIVLIAYSMLLVYTCLVPFDFVGPVDREHTIAGLHADGVHVPDILANIALYVPIGALGCAELRRVGLRTLPAIGGAILLAGAESFAVEQAQRFIGSRFASWVDVTANVLGGVIGAGIVAICHGAIHRVISRTRAQAGQNWYSAAAKGAVCLLLVLHLRPYDVVVDMRRAAAGLLRGHANLHPLAAWHGLPAGVAKDIGTGRRSAPAALDRVRWEYALDRAVDALGYAGLSILLALGIDQSVRRNRRGSGHDAGGGGDAAGRPIGAAMRRCAGIGFVVLSLAIMVTLIRTFLISHGLDTAHFVCAVIGWVGGCAIAGALGVFRPGAGDREPGAAVAGRESVRSRAGRLPPGLVAAGLACGFVFPLLYELVPFDFHSGSGSSGSLVGALVELPFARHVLNRPNDAFYDLSGDFIRYGAVGFCIAVLCLRRPDRPWRGQFAAIVAIVAVLCAAVQVVQFYIQSRRPDVTTIVIAVLAAATAVIAVRWARDYGRFLSVVAVDDPLTRQLVEGRTYDKSSDVARLAKKPMGAGTAP